MKRFYTLCSLIVILCTAPAAAQIPARMLERPQTYCTVFVAPGTNNIQSAVDSLPASGGTVCLSSGTYTQTGSPISIGDGTSSALATHHGVRIVGVASPITSMLHSFSTSAATIIDCTGTTASNCFGINGIEGWGFENLVINGSTSGVDSTGIRITSGRWGSVKNVFINGFKRGLHLTTWSSFTPGGNFDVIGNFFEGVSIKMGSGGTIGVHLDGAASGANADFNIFRRISVSPANGSTCIELGWADGNTIENFHCFGGGTTVTGLKFNYGGPNSPQNNYFYGLEVADYPVSNSGSPGSTPPNYIFGFAEANGGTCPDLANLHVFGCTTNYAGKLAVRGATSGVITVQPQAAAGTYNFNLPTTAGTAGQVLTSQGGGSTAMTWSTVSGGSGDLVSTLTSAEISITTTATATISRMHVISGTSASYTITLPTAVGNAGKLIGFRVATSGATKLYTLDGNSTETIDGALTRIMWAGESAILLSDGSNWFKIAGRSLPMSAAMFNSAVTSMSHATVTKIAINSTDTDNTGLMSDTSNNRINIQRPSTYLVTAEAVVGASDGTGALSADSARIIVIVQNNGSQISTAEVPGVSNGFPSPVAVRTISLASGDQITLHAYQQTGVTQGARGGASLANGGSQISVTEVPQW